MPSMYLHVCTVRLWLRYKVSSLSLGLGAVNSGFSFGFINGDTTI
uniref:Uncharacterized protein n=1 Tax=Anguilla anguilla TaxID=7936 RepID=A0A0E9UHS6_ANGAN